MTPPHYSGTFDEYAKQLLRQNQNLPCAHCGSSLGHTQHVPLSHAMRQSWPVHSRLPSVP